MMISLLNFGDSPFRLLFYMVIGIFCAVLLANIIALAAAKIINRSADRIMQTHDKAKPN